MILVTGGTGYIGSHTVVELLSNNEDVIIVDNFSNSNPIVLDKIRKITNKDFKFYEIDITNMNDFEIVFKENDIDSVIHFAALKAVGESVEKPLQYYTNNLVNTLLLLNLMKKYDVNNLVFSSSATVYGSPNSCPITEDFPLSTTNPYGSHKSGLIGENPNGVPNNLMPYIVKVAAGELPHLNIFGNDYNTPDGTGVRDYIHVVDLAKGHLKSLDKLKENPGIITYNLGTGKGYSVLDLVKSFEKINNVEVAYKITNRRLGDISSCYSNPAKANQELSWYAEFGIEDMCKDSWNFVNTNYSSEATS